MTVTSGVGFTGTSRGAQSNLQREVLASVLRDLLNVNVSTLRHGDCVGGDALAHEIALNLGASIHIYPPVNPRARAFCRGFTWIDQPREYIVRNRCIVDNSKVIVGMPGTMQEELRSGTWATIRYARKCWRSVIIVWPNGTITVEPSELQMDLYPALTDEATKP